MMQKLSLEIEQILSGYQEATVAISLIDPSSHFHFNLNGDKIFHAASLMKVPVMIEVYRLASRGVLSLNDALNIKNQFRSVIDQSVYRIEQDTDEHTYQYLGKTLPIRKLVFQMITVSSNIATNILLEVTGIESIQSTIQRLGTNKSKVLRGVEDLKSFERGLNNTVTSSDMALLLKRLLDGQAISPSFDERMIEILLSQKIVDMIPAGLPQNCRVAHKTGDITQIHHDAGIVFPATGKPYILVILIEGIKSYARSSQLGATISKLVYHFLRA